MRLRCTRSARPPPRVRKHVTKKAVVVPPCKGPRSPAHTAARRTAKKQAWCGSGSQARQATVFGALSSAVGAPRGESRAFWRCRAHRAAGRASGCAFRRAAALGLGAVCGAPSRLPARRSRRRARACARPHWSYPHRALAERQARRRRGCRCRAGPRLPAARRPSGWGSSSVVSRSSGAVRRATTCQVRQCCPTTHLLIVALLHLGNQQPVVPLHR